MNYKSLKLSIDAAIFNAYIVSTGMVSVEEMMTKITQKKNEILQQHIDNVYPIKETRDGMFYTKFSPKNRNHSGKISAKTKEDLELKILAHYLNISVNQRTFKQILDEIVLDYAKTNQKETGIRHKQEFNRHCSDWLDKSIDILTAEMITKRLQSIIDNGIKAKAFERLTGSLNCIYRYCKKNNYPCINISNIITEWKTTNLTGKHIYQQDNRLTKNLVFTKDETIKLIKYALEHPTFQSLFIGLILTTGCRMGELLCMSYDNIDLDRNLFYVYEIEDSHTQKIKPYTKNHLLREVYLNSNARLLLNTLLTLRRQYKDDTKYLFLNPECEDGKCHARSIDNYVRRVQVQLDFDTTKELRSTHDGRRTYATLQYLDGVDLKVIQRQLGHRTVKQTEDYIQDVIDTSRRAKELEQKGILDLSA